MLDIAANVAKLFYRFISYDSSLERKEESMSFYAITNAVLVSLILFAIIFTAFLWIKKKLNTGHGIIAASAIRHLSKPLLFLITIIAVRSGTIFIPTEHTTVRDFLEHIVAIGIIIAVMWLIAKLVDIFSDVIISRFDITNSDNLRARKVYTQLKVLRRIVIIVLCFIGLASILMTFDKVRQLGTSLMASAGVIGIIVGVAAQKTLHTFLTGIQIAITQPIRIDDVVIVENEWGRIEEIALTYVTVRIWDQRRLIVPITYFIDQPFQNWTRVTADILGTVFIYVDYTIPVEEVRKKLSEIVEQSPLWDKRVCGLQVTNATERTVELRALVSAADASNAWDLRCFVREKLIDFIKTQYPDSLPKVRAQFEQDAKPAKTEQV